MHDVANRSPRLATSIHAYSRPLTAMGFYGADGSLVRTEAVHEQSALVSPSELARALHPSRARAGRSREPTPRASTPCSPRPGPGLRRVEVAALADEVAAGALVVDIRPEVNRRAEGELPGAVVIDRNVLEWRLDPTSGHHLPEASTDRRVILVCNEGYASSLAAATLVDLGITGATDLVGGYRAWLAARPPME